jgi:hypothetical protein
MAVEVDPLDVFNEASGGSRIVLVRASSLKPERVTFAWEQRVPIGMVSLLVGEGGLGKSLQFCSLAAGWTRGTILGDFYGTPIDVAIASAEDHRQAVIIPRLLAAGADLSRVHFLEQIDADGDPSDIDIDGQVAVLERALVAGNVRVVLVDTVVAHIPAEHDTYKEQRVRAVLKPLAKMAERNNLVVFGTMHLNRREARDVLTRISGSGAFGNLARSVLLFAPDPDDPEGLTRILAIGKTNVGAVAATLKLRVEPCLVPHDDGGEITTARLVVVEESNYTSTQLLGVPDGQEERDAVTEAEQLLRELLAAGAVEARLVMAEAKASGVAEKTLRRAGHRLKVKTNDRGGFGPGFPSRWSLPAHDTPTRPRVGGVPSRAYRENREDIWPSREPDDEPPADTLPLLSTPDAEIQRLREMVAINERGGA